MKTSDKRSRQQWGVLARQLLFTSSRQAACPECGKPALSVNDLEYGGGAAHGLVRYITCSNCDGFDFVTLRRAGILSVIHTNPTEMVRPAAEATRKALLQPGVQA
jgi:hypothetical protein